MMLLAPPLLTSHNLELTVAAMGVDGVDCLLVLGTVNSTPKRICVLAMTSPLAMELCGPQIRFRPSTGPGDGRIIAYIKAKWGGGDALELGAPQKHCESIYPLAIALENK